MATVLIVSGSYFPYATANAVCTKKFEDVLKQHGHKVIYCNRKHDLSEPDNHIYEGTELNTVGKNSDLFFQTMTALNRLELPNKMHSCFSLSYRFFRICMKMRNLFVSTSKLRKNASDFYINQYSDRILSIVENENVDVIISVSMPFDSHLAVKMTMTKLENKHLAKPKWIAYCIDAYWSKAGTPTSDVKMKKDEERTVFKSCDMILFLDTIADDYTGPEFDYCRHKFQALPLPLFDLKQTKAYNAGISPDKKRRNYVYTGTIYDDFRNVDALAEILIRSEDTTAAVHFMGKIYPRSLNTLEQLDRNFRGKIYLHGRQSYDYAKGSMQKADILINLANNNANQIPSKIFEYIACRKPILNIYERSDDVGTQYLKKYPLAFNFNINDMENQLKEMSGWLKTIDERSVTYDQLKNIYNSLLTETVVDEFYHLVLPYLSADK